MNIVDIAAETARQNGGRVVSLHLKLGALSGVVKEALEFSWRMASVDTVLEGSRLEIEEIPLVVRCKNCEADRKLDSINNFSCPVCREISPEIVRGKELELTSMEII